MHCATCALSISNSLFKKEGVKKADVNFGTEKAVVEFDPNTRFGHYIKSMERFLRMGSTFYSPREIRKLLAVNGFTVSRQYYIDGTTYVTVARKTFG